MDYYKEDIEKAKRIVTGRNSYVDDLAALYKNTNEDLTKILKNIDFKDKKVLTVQASSDQLFSSLILGAEEVDTFDANRLTEYYYYLRKWCLEETKKYYLSANDTLLEKIIKKHYDENNKAASLWLELIKEAKPNLYYSKLFFKTPIYWSVPFKGREEELIELLKDKDHKFNCINIYEKTDINKKYDIIIISNIIEYLIDGYYKECELQFTENMKDLLKEDGIIISSKVLNSHYQETELDKYFDVQAGEEGMILYGGETAPLSYQYTKKKIDYK